MAAGHCMKQKTNIERFCCHDHAFAEDKIEENGPKGQHMLLTEPLLKLMQIVGMIKKCWRGPSNDQQPSSCHIWAVQSSFLVGIRYFELTTEKLLPSDGDFSLCPLLVTCLKIDLCHESNQNSSPTVILPWITQEQGNRRYTCHM